MFNRSEEEYYVALYKKSEKDAILYSSIINKYANEEKSLKVYFCDLENKFNEEYYVGNENSNPKAKTIADVKFGDFTLVKISKGKIVKYVENIEDMKKELNINTEKDNNKQYKEVRIGKLTSFLFYYSMIELSQGDNVKNTKGFNLISVILIIVVVAVIAGVTTGIIMTNSYHTVTTDDEALNEFLRVRSEERRVGKECG